MSYMAQVMEDIETHNAQAISECFRNGISPNVMFRNESLQHELTGEYHR